MFVDCVRNTCNALAACDTPCDVFWSTELSPPEENRVITAGGAAAAASVKTPAAESCSFIAIPWLQAVRRVRKLLRLPVGPPVQRLYPQCRACSVKQARAARVSRRTLVFHHGGVTRPRLHHLAGAFVFDSYVRVCGFGRRSNRYVLLWNRINMQRWHA